MMDLYKPSQQEINPLKIVTKKLTPKILYGRAIARGDLATDEYQLLVIDELQELHSKLLKPKWKRKKVKGGIYIQGSVGRGKTMLMNMFRASLQGKIKVKRIHFHEFMSQIHKSLHDKRAKPSIDNNSLLPAVAKDLASHTKVLCLDEFHVRDIADAMILTRLMDALLNAGIVVIITSNDMPCDLYPQGIQRDLFLPFIDLVNEKLNVITLDGDLDYRKNSPIRKSFYFYPARNSHKAWDAFAKNSKVKPVSIPITGRTIELKATKSAAWASFASLCERPCGADDYMKLSKNFDTIFINGVPKMGYDRRNEILRFMTLIDVLYDEGARVSIIATTTTDKLCATNHIDFSRTESRLNELAYRGWENY